MSQSETGIFVLLTPIQFLSLSYYIGISHYSLIHPHMFLIESYKALFYHTESR